MTQDFAHIVASYTEKQFQEAVVSAFNQVRRARGLPVVDAITDARLRKAACAHDMNTSRIIRSLSGAVRLFVFSATEPGSLPQDLRAAATAPSLERMNIGVCLPAGGKPGFTHFWVVAAFYQ